MNAQHPDIEFLDEAEGKNNGGKRKDYLPWDEYFMGIALLSAERSKDPSTRVGACIVDENKRIVGIGYNGFPVGCSDDELPWAREAACVNDTKYPYVVHAEVNAVLNSSKSLKGSTLYVALFPCNECAKVLIQSGIAEIVYISDKYAETESVKASKRMFKMTGVKLRKLEPKTKEITLEFNKD